MPASDGASEDWEGLLMRHCARLPCCSSGAGPGPLECLWLANHAGRAAVAVQIGRFQLFHQSSGSR